MHRIQLEMRHMVKQSANEKTSSQKSERKRRVFLLCYNRDPYQLHDADNNNSIEKINIKIN